jgi:hypothetical protein
MELYPIKNTANIVISGKIVFPSDIENKTNMFTICIATKHGTRSPKLVKWTI